MGAVWRAYDSIIRRYVAQKLLSRAGRTADARERLLREARAAGALQHPNIVTIYELGEADGQLFIAMELIDGRDLSTLIALSEPLALERDRKSTRLNSSHSQISYAVFCLKKNK